MSDAETVDGTAEEIGTELQPVQAPAANVALFGTSDPVEVVAEATKVANALASVIEAKKLYVPIQGNNHVRVEGWQLLGSMLGVTAVCTATEPVEGGFRATVEARTADGRVVGRADALCTKAESKWKSVDDYARLSMAQTRATSKALKGPLGFVVSLAGYQTTPAEEMPESQAPPEPPPPAEPLDPERVNKIGAGIGALKLSYKDTGLMFGALGANWRGEESGEGLRRSLEALTPEQATAMEAEMEKLAQTGEGADNGE